MRHPFSWDAATWFCMFLIAGLGNPGTRYAATRHNIGFMAVDAIAGMYGFPAFASRHHSECSKGNIRGFDVLLVKPQTFMNRSGVAMGEVARFYKIPLNHTWVVYDELDLAAGKIRIKTGGSNGGHNGIKSIDQHLGKDYGRVRLGIGRPEHKNDVTSYVLADFSGDEHHVAQKLIEALAQELPALLEGRQDIVMNNVARTLSPAVHSSQKKD